MVGVWWSQSDRRCWIRSSVSHGKPQRLKPGLVDGGCAGGGNVTVHPRDEPREGVRLVSVVGKDVEFRALGLPAKLKDL